MLAAAEGRLAIIQYLLKNGADQELKDYRKQTAADWAEGRVTNMPASIVQLYNKTLSYPNDGRKLK